MLPAWVAFTLADGERLGGGESVEEATRAVLAHPFARAGRLIALGVNCSAPGHVTPALTAMRAVGKQVPFVVYPNSGETWDGAGRAWRGEAGHWLPQVRAWVGLGAVVVGGCCRVPAETLPLIQAELVRGLCQA